MRIAEHVRRLQAYTPGEQPKSRNVVKLNTNENPYPPSPACAKVLADFDLDLVRRYPDPVFSALRERVSGIWDVPAECVFAGNGSDEILSLCAKAFVDDGEKIGSLDPSYSLYRTLADIRNAGFVPTPLDNNFKWDGRVLGNPALFLLTNPNAPTGTWTDTGMIADFARTFPGVLVVDEAYADFAGDSAMELAKSMDNVIVMRTLSKSFSLAGLRLGYCVGPADLVDALYKIKDSYNVDAIAQAIACAALGDMDWMRANTVKITATRDRVADELRRRGWDVPRSRSNFLFARPAVRPAADVFRELRERNIYTRYFPGERTKDRIRISIGTDAEMDVLLDALAAIDAV